MMLALLDDHQMRNIDAHRWVWPRLVDRMTPSRSGPSDDY